MQKKEIISTVLCLGLPLVAQAQVNASANFDRWIDYPLTKKISVYQTPLGTKPSFERDIPKLSELECLAMRYEIAWGKDVYAANCIGGTKENPTYNFTDLDYFFDKCKDHTPTFVFSQGYTPTIIQQNGDWQKPPSDYGVWAQINKRFAQHWKEKNYTNSYIEVWNEPDLTNVFFRGDVDDYLKIYEYAAPAIREGDADVKIGGPAGAGAGWHAPLVNMVKSKGLPLDFLSGHAYGQSYTWQLDAMRSQLNVLGNKQAEMILSEYAPYPTDLSIHADGPVEQADAAVTFFDALPTMLEYTDLTYVTWAQYIDPTDPHTGATFGRGGGDKMGLVEGNTGDRKALFNAFKLYGMMPADRRYLTVGAPFKGMASADDNCVAACIWNTSNSKQDLHFTLKKIPFTSGTLEIYHIDKHINSWYETGMDDLVPDRRLTVDIVDGQYVIDSYIRERGVFFVRIMADPAIPTFPINPFAKVIRTHQWYESRSNNYPYAFFDQKTWTARLSSNEKVNGWAIMAVAAEDVPDQFEVVTKTSGNLLDRDANSTLNMRIDFRSTNGDYVKSVLFHGGLYHSNRTQVIPWGTQQAPDQVVQVENFDRFTVNLNAYKPDDFDGRILITFDMANVGDGSKANFQLCHPGDIQLMPVTADQTSGEGVVLTGTVVGEGNIGECGFLYAKDDDPKNGGVQLTSTLSGMQFTAQLNDLVVMTNYHVRAYAKLSDGKTIYSPESVFRTLAAKATVRTYRPEVDEEKMEAFLQGRVISDNGTYVRQRGFAWCIGDFEPTLADELIYVQEGTGVFDYTLQSLSPNTQYSVRAFAINQGGVAYGATYSFTTGSAPDGMPWKGVPARIPGRIECEEFDSGGRGVTWDWNAGPCGGQGRAAGDGIDFIYEGYRLGWLTDTDENWAIYTVQVIRESDYDIISTSATIRFDIGDYTSEKGTQFSHIHLKAGVYQMKVWYYSGTGDADCIDFVDVGSYIPEDYTGIPWTEQPQVIPGKIECEYFDRGDRGVVWDWNAGPFAGQGREAGDGIQFIFGGFRLGWLDGSDDNWTVFTVHVNEEADYDIVSTTATIRFQLGDVETDKGVLFNKVHLPQGNYLLKVWYYAGTGDADYIDFQLSDGSGIVEVVSPDAQQPAIIYNMQGQRLARPGRGIHIVNGKKILL